MTFCDRGIEEQEQTRRIEVPTPITLRICNAPITVLRDELWSKLEKILLQHAIYHKLNLRMTVEDILYQMRVGCPWRDLPGIFGGWNSIYKHFNAWSATGKWLKVFHALLEEPDFEWAFIDGTYVKAHQHSTGAASAHREGLGKSRAGLTSKIHLAVNAQDLPVAFEVTGGDVHDSSANPLIRLNSVKLTAFPVIAPVGATSVVEFPDWDCSSDTKRRF